MDEFSESFDDADQVILLPIYAARELPDPEVSSDLLANRMAGRDVSVQMAADFDDARRKIMELADENTLILTQGAGDVYKIADNLLNT
jgi:UDP-N-acetylmuramate--alanine ligase